MKNNSFSSLYKGTFNGIIKEKDYENLANSLNGKWTSIEFDNSNANITFTSAEKITDIMLSIKNNMQSNSQPIPYTYVHTKDEPKIIKIYKTGGSSCSRGTANPYWVFTNVAMSKEELKNISNKKTKIKKTNWFLSLFKPASKALS